MKYFRPLPHPRPLLALLAVNCLPPVLSLFFGLTHRSVILQVVDYETQTSYRLTIQVTDGGSPTLSSTCVLDVRIISVDEFAPVMSVPNFSTNLLETTAVGTVVYHTNATDSDVGKGSAVTYSIPAGNTNDDFFCYSTTGDIIVWNSLDYDTPPQVRLCACRWRVGNGCLSSHQPLWVTVVMVVVWRRWTEVTSPSPNKEFV